MSFNGVQFKMVDSDIVLFVSLTLGCLASSIVALLWDTSPVIRAVPYENTQVQRRLNRPPLAIHKVTSTTHCAIYCTKHAKCRSFNYCGFICQLNLDDVFSSLEGENLIIFDKSCVYVGMRKDAQPICKDMESFVNINDKDDKSECEINRKKVDLEWGDWGSVEISEDTETNFKQIRRRYPTIEAAHGGITSNENEEIFIWLRWVKILKSWDEARDNCAQLGGKLFSKVDGTTEQLDFFLAKMDQQSHWLGIYTLNHTEWINVDGLPVEDPLLVWDPNQKFNYKGVQYHVSNSDGFSMGLKIKYLNDENKYEKRYSVCDMN